MAFRDYFIFLFILILNIQESINELIKEGEIKTIYLYNLRNIILYSKKNFGLNSPMLIHFLSIDCDIQIEELYKNELEMKINNFNYGAYSVLINDNETKLNIYPLINSSIERFRYRNYPLIINRISFADSTIPQLNAKENLPIFLNFNEFLTKIKLVYNFIENNDDNPIIISFYIKEKIKFKIEISDDDEKNITNKIVDEKENIIFRPEHGKAYNIFITPYEEDIINSTMIVKIIQNNSTPFYLQKNVLNLGFIPKNIDCYYYYMEIYKGEEGEIMLFNKRQNGILISKIIEKNIDNIKIPEIDEFPMYKENEELSNNYSKFNIYSQKLSFNSSLSGQNCDFGCYLLITYYSNISESLNINGTEFSILSRIWDKEELKSQIINIPLNEYTFGIFDETIIRLVKFTFIIKQKNK